MVLVFSGQPLGFKEVADVHPLINTGPSTHQIGARYDYHGSPFRT
jgi:hypothetical protein